MSFSSDVKEELVGHVGTSRHCQLAEIAAIISAIGYVEVSSDGQKKLFLQTDNE